METGYILIIDNTIKFEYYKLPKPITGDFLILALLGKMSNVPISGKVLDTKKYNKAIKKYEASKKTIEVSNEYSISKTLNHCHISFKDKSGKLIDLITNIPNKQPCKAEVKGTATILNVFYN